MNDADRFLERFAQFGRTPSPELYEQLYAEEGTVLHPGMTQPVHRRNVAAYMAGVLATLPEFGFEILTSCAGPGLVFVEALNSARLNGERVEWKTVYCISLEGDRVLRGRAYFDRIPLLARVFPTLTLSEAAALGVPAPGTGDA